MKKIAGVLILSVLFLSLASAVQITIVDKPNTFSGAVLRVGSETGDKIYPVEERGGAMVRFNVSYSGEAMIYVTFVKDGNVLEGKNLVRGPYDFSEDIMINLDEEMKANSTEDVEEVINETVVVNEDASSQPDTSEVTGKVVSDSSSSGHWRYYLGGGIILALVAVFAVIKFAYVSGSKSAVKAIGKMELDRRIDELDE